MTEPKRSNTYLWICAVAFAVTGCAIQPTSRSPAEPGHRLAERRCSSCHAIGLTDASPRRDALALRDLYKRYPFDSLRASFLDGVHVGHPDMPTFRLSRSEVDELLSYLRSIDPCAQPSTDRVAMNRCFSPL
jgi:cytochrome c